MNTNTAIVVWVALVTVVPAIAAALGAWAGAGFPMWRKSH